MRQAFRALDRILRGEATRLPLLREGRFDVPVGPLLALIILLGMIYGACMGLSSVITHWSPDPNANPQVIGDRMDGFKQMGASIVKVPLLFVLTVIVTFPSLYVFNALVGSRLTITSVLRLVVAALSVMLALLASFGTIVAFFAASTNSYPFMKLLNVVVFAIAGFMGLAFLLQTLHRLTIAQEMAPPPEPTISSEGGEAPPSPLPPSAADVGALDRLDDRPTGANVKAVFRIWVIVFGLVGAQMSWVLRPFVGSPYLPFKFFRGRESNFFEGVMQTLGHLFSWTGR
jgi:hypothetical protein